MIGINSGGKMKKVITILIIILLLTGCLKEKNSEPKTSLNDKNTVQGFAYSSGILLSNILPDEYTSIDFSGTKIIFNFFEEYTGNFNDYKPLVFNEIKRIADDGKVYDIKGSLISEFNQNMVYRYKGKKVNIEVTEEDNTYVLDIKK